MKKAFWNKLAVIILVLAVLCAGCTEDGSPQTDPTGSSADNTVGEMTNSTTAGTQAGSASQPNETTNTQAQSPTDSTAPETTAPTQPPETAAPTQPPETAAPTQPPETAAPTQPPATTVPTQPPETAAPTQPPETAAPTQPEETVPSEESRVDTLFVNANGAFVEDEDHGAVKKIVIQYDDQGRTLYRGEYSLITGKQIFQEEHTYTSDGGQTILSYSFNEDGSFLMGYLDVMDEENRLISQTSYSAVDKVHGQKELTYHANGNVASEKYSDVAGEKSQATYRENGTLIRSELLAADGFQYIRECNEAGDDIYVLSAFPDGTFTEQTWNDAGILTKEVQQDSDGTQYISYYRDDGKERERYENAPDGTTRKSWRWDYDDAGKLTYSVFYNEVSDSMEVWYNEAEVRIQERIIDGDTGDAEYRYYDDQGNLTGTSSHFMEDGLFVTLAYDAAGVLKTKTLRDWDDSYCVIAYDATGKEISTSYYDSEGKLLNTVYH